MCTLSKAGLLKSKLSAASTAVTLTDFTTETFEDPFTRNQIGITGRKYKINYTPKTAFQGHRLSQNNWASAKEMFGDKTLANIGFADATVSKDEMYEMAYPRFSSIKDVRSLVVSASAFRLRLTHICLNPAS
jgi:hypothetical protein